MCNKWAFIETAPKDETGVLLFYPEVDRKIPSGIIEGWYFSSPKEIDDGWETIIGSIGEPTHWQPLPPPPTVSVEEEIESLLQDMRWKPPATVAVTAGEGGEWIEFGANNPTLIHSIKFADGSKWDSFNGWRPYKLPPPPTAREECICWMDIQSKDCPVHGNNPSPGGEEDEICCETIGNSNFCIRHNRDIHQCIIKAGAGKLNPSPSDLSTVKERGKNVTQFSDIDDAVARDLRIEELEAKQKPIHPGYETAAQQEAQASIDALETQRENDYQNRLIREQSHDIDIRKLQARIKELEAANWVPPVDGDGVPIRKGYVIDYEMRRLQADLAKAREALKEIMLLDRFADPGEPWQYGNYASIARTALGKET